MTLRKEIAARGIPLLGICLGMQMLLDESEEFGITAGLGLIPGRVVPVPTVTAAGNPQKIPHIGWNALVPPERRASWDGTVLRHVSRGRRSISCTPSWPQPADPEHRIADCIYGGAADFRRHRHAKRLGVPISPRKERSGWIENIAGISRGRRICLEPPLIKT